MTRLATISPGDRKGYGLPLFYTWLPYFLFTCSALHKLGKSTYVCKVGCADGQAVRRTPSIPRTAFFRFPASHCTTASRVGQGAFREFLQILSKGRSTGIYSDLRQTRSTEYPLTYPAGRGRTRAGKTEKNVLFPLRGIRIGITTNDQQKDRRSHDPR